MNSLLVYDAPNIDVFVSDQYGNKPTRDQRPNMRVLVEWLKTRTGEEKFAACVFVNIDEYTREKLRGWLRSLQKIGYYTYAKPRTPESTDFDEAVIKLLEQQKAPLRLDEVIVVSNDANNFEKYLEKLASEGIHPVVLGFEELSSRFISNEQIEFIDLEDIPDLFSKPIPGRLRLTNLPSEGQLFPPIGEYSGIKLVMGE